MPKHDPRWPTRHPDLDASVDAAFFVVTSLVAVTDITRRVAGR
jgi:hypothetical protein